MRYKYIKNVEELNIFLENEFNRVNVFKVKKFKHIPDLTKAFIFNYVQRILPNLDLLFNGYSHKKYNKYYTEYVENFDDYINTYTDIKNLLSTFSFNTLKEILILIDNIKSSITYTQFVSIKKKYFNTLLENNRGMTSDTLKGRFLFTKNINFTIPQYTYGGDTYRYEDGCIIGSMNPYTSSNPLDFPTLYRILDTLFYNTKIPFETSEFPDLDIREKKEETQVSEDVYTDFCILVETLNEFVRDFVTPDNNMNTGMVYKFEFIKDTQRQEFYTENTFIRLDTYFIFDYIMKTSKDYDTDYLTATDFEYVSDSLRSLITYRLENLTFLTYNSFNLFNSFYNFIHDVKRGQVREFIKDTSLSPQKTKLVDNINTILENSKTQPYIESKDPLTNLVNDIDGLLSFLYKFIFIVDHETDNQSLIRDDIRLNLFLGEVFSLLGITENKVVNEYIKEKDFDITGNVKTQGNTNSLIELLYLVPDSMVNTKIRQEKKEDIETHQLLSFSPSVANSIFVYSVFLDIFKEKGLFKTSTEGALFETIVLHFLHSHFGEVGAHILSPDKFYPDKSESRPDICLYLPNKTLIVIECKFSNIYMHKEGLHLSDYSVNIAGRSKRIFRYDNLRRGYRQLLKFKEDFENDSGLKEKIEAEFGEIDEIVLILTSPYYLPESRLKLQLANEYDSKVNVVYMDKLLDFIEFLR